MSFRKFDIYRKTVDGVTTQTRIGGAVSLVSFVIVSVLLFTELRDYLGRDLVSRMKVDSAIANSVVNIKFDVLFPEVHCSRISFQEETNANTKRPGRINMKDADEGGCSVVGSVFAESVAGFIKLSVGAMGSSNAKASDGKPLGLGKDTDVSLSHSIKYFEVFPEGLSVEQLAAHSGDLHNPLNQQSTELSTAVALHQYHLQIVPTSFKPLSLEDPLGMHQYSVYERSIERSFPKDAFALNGHQIQKFYGLLFTYDFYPVTVMMEERQEGFFEFLINLCAIVGGTLTVLGLVNVGIHTSAKTLIGKND